MRRAPCDQKRGLRGAAVAVLSTLADVVESVEGIGYLRALLIQHRVAVVQKKAQAVRCEIRSITIERTGIH
jgi:methyl coenzyme M reductase beta subunit